MAAVIVPAHLSSDKPTLDPYGHLLRMLVPRASGIAFFDARGGLLSAVVLLTRDGENRPFSFLMQMVRPALECLQRELQARASVGLLSSDLRSRDQDLELLLHLSPSEAQDPRDADELALLMQRCVDHLDVMLGALVVPERNVAICKARAGSKPRVDVLSKTHRHLLNWATLQRRTLVINSVGSGAAPEAGLPPVKMLSVPVRHASNRVIGFLALFRGPEQPDFDVRSERLSELLARKVTSVLQNNFDGATSLLTRPAFENHVRAFLASRHDSAPHSVLYIDVDRLHVVNDNFGMHIGDESLVKIAEILRRKPRPNAITARVSGDRFTVFLPDCPLEQAAQVGEEIRQQCADLTHTRGDGTVQVSVSVGVAELPGSRAPLAHGLANAEIACKAAKDRGRDRVEVFQDGDQSIMRRHSDVLVVQRLHEAIEHNRFVLHAQPILPLGGDTGAPRFELLLRMVGEGGEILPPAKFLSAAERYQMLPAIDRWVIQHALKSLGKHRASLEGNPARFSINVSGPSIAAEDFLDFLEGSVRSSGLPPELLCFELTETAAVSNLPRAERLMQRMRSLGCTFALDDFGTGVSSLSYLKTLPVQVLKIDGSFVRDSGTSQRTESMVKAIAQLARIMGMETVAEFVETDELRVRMAALGVDFGQGFAIGRPTPLDEVLGDLALYEMLAQNAGPSTRTA